MDAIWACADILKGKIISIDTYLYATRAIIEIGRDRLTCLFVDGFVYVMGITPGFILISELDRYR